MSIEQAILDARILIVDDQAANVQLLTRLLVEAGYTQVTSTLQPTEVCTLHRQHAYDLILLDLNLPDMSGHEVLRQLRMARIETPILILSGSDDTDNKIRGFGFGADDYMTKPFDMRELLARLRALLRRVTPAGEESNITLGELSVNLADHEASVSGKPLPLTPIEFSLLKVLAEHAGRIITQSQIIRQIWPTQASDASEGLRVHISHLRRKLGPTGPRLINEPGIGYRLVEE